MWQATKLPAYQRHVKTHPRLYRPAKALVFRVDRHRKTSPPPSYLATDRRSVGSRPALSRRPEQEDTTHRVLRHRGREHNLADPSLFSWIPDEPDSVAQQIFVRRRNHHTGDLTGNCDSYRMPSSASYRWSIHTVRQSTSRIGASATPSVAGLRRSRTITLPIASGGRWPRRLVGRGRALRLPAVPATCGVPRNELRFAPHSKEQRRFFTPVLATGEHSSPVTSASTAGVRSAPGPRAPKTFQNASG